MTDELLTPAQAATFLGISVGAFYKLRVRHRIPNRGRGRCVRVFRSDLVRAETVGRVPRMPPSQDWLATAPTAH